ncbi:MAG: exosortase family protein XrtF [Cytophagales bacterium]|nr:exosortase family protein XrtF [Cytophagales bacterium]
MQKTVKNPLFRFLSSALILFALWFMVYESWLKNEGTVDDWLTETVTVHSVWVLSQMGYDVSVGQSSVWTSILCDGFVLLNIADSCNGLVLYALFVGFFIAFPGRWKPKLWFSLAGSVVIYLLNVARIVALSFIQMYHPEYLDISHKYVFTLVVYGAIMGMWWLWVNRYSLFAVKDGSKSPEQEKEREVEHE